MSNRTAYDNDLNTLDSTLQSMGSLSRQALNLVLATLSDGQASHLEDIPDLRSQLTRLERNVEHQCLVLLLRQQPVATDLRKVSTSLKVVENLRRMGDFAEDMADILRSTASSALCTSPCHEALYAMAEQARSMSERAIHAFRSLDCLLADEVIEDDGRVDNAFLALRGRLASYITGESGELALDCLMLAKYLERLADHAVSIAEWTRFCATGIHKNHRIV